MWGRAPRRADIRSLRRRDLPRARTRIRRQAFDRARLVECARLAAMPRARARRVTWPHWLWRTRATAAGRGDGPGGFARMPRRRPGDSRARAHLQEAMPSF